MYNDKKALITMMLNRLIRALGECTFFNHYLVSLSFFFKQNLLFPEFICLKIAVDND